MEPPQGGIKSLQGIEWVGHPLPMPKYFQQLSEFFNVFSDDLQAIEAAERERDTGSRVTDRVSEFV